MTCSQATASLPPLHCLHQQHQRVLDDESPEQYVPHLVKLRLDLRSAGALHHPVQVRMSLALPDRICKQEYQKQGPCCRVNQMCLQMPCQMNANSRGWPLHSCKRANYHIARVGINELSRARSARMNLQKVLPVGLRISIDISSSLGVCAVGTAI